jgi:hypothetical protein
MDRVDEALPREIDIFGNDEENFRTQYRDVFADRLTALSNITTSLLRETQAEEERYAAALDEAGDELPEAPRTIVGTPRVRAMIRRLYDAWLRFYVERIELMRQIDILVLHETEEDGRRKTLRTSPGLDVFYEILRLYYLQHYPALLVERDNLDNFDISELRCDNYATLTSLKRTRHPCWVNIVNSYEPESSADAQLLALKAAIQALWNTPILDLSQRQLYLVILFLAQELNDVPTASRGEVVEEFRSIFHVVMLRAAELSNEWHPASVLDDETMRRKQGQTDLFSVNRRWCGFVTFHLGEILRRFFYYDLTRLRGLELPERLDVGVIRESARAWVRAKVDSFAEQAFDDLYSGLAKDAYHFVGDDEWFRFGWPQRVHSRGACVTELRPHLYNRFYSEAQVTKDSVLNATGRSYMARLFVLHAIDEHLKMQVARCEWFNAVVIPNEGIEQASLKLRMNAAPLIVQVFSSFWCYDRGRVYVTDDIYECFGVWCWLLRIRYQNVLHDVPMEPLLRGAIPSTEAELPRGGGGAAVAQEDQADGEM